MIKKSFKNLNIRQIAISGQCFRINEIAEGTFEILAADKRLIAKEILPELKDSEPITYSFDCTAAEFDAFWAGYFDLKTDYGKIVASIDRADLYLSKAASACPGVRILRQDLWETMVTFLISQQNNISRIKKSVEALCKKYGEKKYAQSGEEFYAFPTADALALKDEDALMSEGLGYRSKYVIRLARAVASGEFNLDGLNDLTYEEARRKLLSVYGIGPKVADCICLFALHHIEAFPIDTHVRQILAAHYAGGFPFDRYDGYAGILQQYMFYYDLHGE